MAVGPFSPLLVESRSQQTSSFAAFSTSVAQHRAKREGRMSGMWLPISPLLLISQLATSEQGAAPLCWPPGRDCANYCLTGGPK